jgi:hypothetical protein
LESAKKGEIRVKDRKKSGYKKGNKTHESSASNISRAESLAEEGFLAHPSERRYSRKAIHRDVFSSCLGLVLQNSQEEAMKWNRFLP